jgi:site-specific recombinase XerC
MSAYLESRMAPRTLTEREQHLLLKVTGDHARGLRDHVLIAMALATALREHELAALNVGDVFDGETARRRVRLHVYKRSNPDPATQEVLLSDRLRQKLSMLRRWKVSRGESVQEDAPLFLSRENKRISLRQIRTLFRTWQSKAGIERPLGFHALRHTAITNLYRGTRDLRLAQRFARHKSLDSTLRYTHASDEDWARAVAELRC